MKGRMEAYTKKLDQSFVMREPAIRSAIRTLQFAPNSHGLDIGCGIGNITGLLAESIASRKRVTGADISPGMVAYATDAAEKAGLTKQLSFRLGDMKDLPFIDKYELEEFAPLSMPKLLIVSDKEKWYQDILGAYNFIPMPKEVKVFNSTAHKNRLICLSSDFSHHCVLEQRGKLDQLGIEIG